MRLRGVLVLDNFICEKILFGVRERKVQEKRGVWRFWAIIKRRIMYIMYSLILLRISTNT